MSETNISLFNAYLEQQKQGLQQELNKLVKQAGFELSTQEVTQLLEERNQAMADNHVLDFSFQNIVTLTKELLDQQKLSKRSYQAQMDELMALFYYLHSLENTGFSDEEIVDRIFRVYAHYDGDLEFVAGFFEDHPNLALEELDEK